MIRESQAYWLRAVGLWLLLMAAETLHGLWRVKVLAVWIGDEFASDVAVFTGSLIILLITFACIDWIPARDTRTLLLVGSTWMVLTIGYEMALGRIAFDGLLAWGQRTGLLTSRSGYAFAHGAEYTLPNGLAVITSYHPSLQNTNTGKLTRPMFLAVFQRARQLAGQNALPQVNQRGRDHEKAFA